MIFGWYHLLLCAGIVALWVILTPAEPTSQKTYRTLSDYGVAIWERQR